MSTAFSFDRPQASPTFRILTVCTGNICRSPFAEQYLRSELEKRGVVDIRVDSAGTMAQDGQTMPPQAQNLARQYGADPEGHKARYLFEGHVAGSDLVFGMGREHRRAVVSMYPRASRYSFTLREFARLADGVTDLDLAGAAALPLSDTSGRLRAAVAAVASRRGLVDAAMHADDDDVVDPYRLDDSVFAESGRQLVPAADVVVRVLASAAALTAPTGEQ
ncbi:low molecular weight phosphatase family protein [Frigoribacterium sp. CFBP 13712]|uniref:arsenate reductase/protein-tyrosine-phosphatase family protein n=1 Tax=Frigoribacterium sp. CFBP 13712 TaxID=2775309 RepID=UPI00178155FA|nr:low molecular weight phosphatase family protein [Frigoribacterium sp. CFBP 13712]